MGILLLLLVLTRCAVFYAINAPPHTQLIGSRKYWPRGWAEDSDRWEVRCDLLCRWCRETILQLWIYPWIEQPADLDLSYWSLGFWLGPVIMSLAASLAGNWLSASIWRVRHSLLPLWGYQCSWCYQIETTYRHGNLQGSIWNCKIQTLLSGFWVKIHPLPQGHRSALDGRTTPGAQSY